jgi:peptidoglycan/LPS O-acetylase OafA/YrhL
MRWVAMTSPRVTQAPAQLPSLTGLRWIAALLVFGLHVHVAEYFGGSAGNVVTQLFVAGKTGVSFFFILSGFILTWSSRPVDRARGFWRRRVARIYPVHVATIVMALVMAFTIDPSMLRLSAWEGVANLFLVQSWTPSGPSKLNPVSWSLACEAFFYALFPLLALAVRRCPVWLTAVLAGLATVLAMVLPTINSHVGLFWSMYYDPLARLPEFLVGMLLARLVLLGRWHGPGVAISLLIAAIGYLLAPRVGGASTATATIIGYGLLIAASAQADLDGTPSPWRHKWLVRLGEISFAFYMIHLLVIRTGEQLFAPHPQLPLLPGLGATAAAFSCSLFLAWVLYRYVETPGRRLVMRGLRPAVSNSLRDTEATPEPASVEASS